MILAAVLLPFLVAAASGTTPASDDALKELHRAFGPTRDLVAACERRQTALQSVQDRDDVDLATELLRAARQLENEAATLATERRRLLGTGSKNKELQARVELDPVRALQDRVQAHMVAMRERAAVQALVEAALEDSRLPLGLRISLARKVADEPGLRKGIERALGQRKDMATLVVACQAVQGLGPAGAPWLERLLADLDHPEPVIREQTAAAVAALARPGGIEPLIRRLGEEKGPATRRAVVRALEVLTGQPLGESLHAWQRWWQENETACLAGDVVLGGGTPSTSQAAQDADQYYSIPITGESIVFLVDRSESMKHLTRKDGEERRIDRAKKELIQALEKLPRHTRFNIVTFSAGSATWADDLRPATPKNVKAAKQWVERMTLQFGTALYDGVDLAFTLAGRPARDDFYSARADTFFVLTDGRPYRAQLNKSGLVADSKSRILADVRRWNLLDRVVIHTIGLGDDIPRKFLRNLANQNGGQFVE